MQTEDDHYDVLISGGGMVGASLACALAQNNFSVALVEAVDYSSDKSSSFDARALALTFSSGAIFRGLNVWQGLGPKDKTTITEIEVSSERRGRVQLHCNDVGREALGWNVEAMALGAQLQAQFEKLSKIQLFSSMTIMNVDVGSDCVTAQLTAIENGCPRNLSAKVLVIADGSQSTLREQLGFKPRWVPYRERALVCRIETDRFNENRAFEHFTSSGPLALLPLGDFGYSIVWTQGPNQLSQRLEISDDDFLAELQACFGNQAGYFRELSSKRLVYPLAISQLKRFVRPRVVIVGNAAHTVHPVAGQGFNLALRDILALADVFKSHRRRGWDIGSYDVLSRYERWRSREGQNVVLFTDSMIRVFGSTNPLISMLRDIGLDVLRAVPTARRKLLLRTMGLYGKQPKSITEPWYDMSN